MVKIVKVKKCHIYYDGMQLFSASDADGGVYFFIRAATDPVETVFVGVSVTKGQYAAALAEQLDVSGFFSNSPAGYLVIKADDELADVFSAEVCEIPGYEFQPLPGLFIRESDNFADFYLSECASENIHFSFGSAVLWNRLPVFLPDWAEKVFVLTEAQPFVRPNNLVFHYDGLVMTNKRDACPEPPRATFVKEGANEDLQFAA